MAGIDIAAASKVFAGQATAVDNLTLSVADRELVVLVGPSGCGKSTTLRMIAGLEGVTSGEIKIGGRRVNEVATKDRNVAMVFQNFALYPHLTVRQNMAFGLQSRQGSGPLKRAACRLLRPARYRELAASQRDIEAAVLETAHSLGLADLLHRLPSQLSGGQRQRVALGRAIVRRPAAFLLDEPLSNLDPHLRAETRRELKGLHRRLQATMLYVTHDQVEAMTLGDRVAVLDHGVLQQFGPPLELYDFPANRFVARFLGSPPMNLLSGRLELRGGELHFVGQGGVLPVDKPAVERVKQYTGLAVQLGIRPEDVSLGAVASSDGAWTTLSAGVVSTEPLGDALVLQLDLCFDGNSRASASGLSEGCGPASVLCKAPARVRASVGDRVTIGIDMRRAHVFDPATGTNVSRPLRAQGN